MLSIFLALFTAWVIGFVVAAGVVLPFVISREVKGFARAAASDIRC